MDKNKSTLTHLILFSRVPQRLLILALSFGGAIMGIFSPYFQKAFIDHLVYQKAFLPDLINFSHPVLYIIFAALCLIASQALNQLSQYIGTKESLLMQRKISALLYDQMMSLKMDTMTQKPIGEIVSLYATDVPGSTVYLDQTLPSGASTFFPLILTPIVLVYFFQTPIAVTLTMMFLISSLNTFLAFRQSKYFYRFKQLAAERLGFANEWIQNIRTLRILGWTEILEQKIINKRKVETENRVKMLANGQIMNSITTCFTFIINVSTLGMLVLYYKKELSPGEIFALLWILGIFLTRPFRQMPWFFTFAFDSATSIRRVENFLNLKNPTQEKTPHLIQTESKTILSLSNLTLDINGRSILNIPRLDIFRNELLVIVGPVGCGKSLLLYSLVDETNCQWSKYEISVNKPVRHWKNLFSFVPQEGLIVSTSLRDNVHLAYGSTKERDLDVLKALEYAAFKKDLDQLAQGLDSELGERGVNLSGGQRQRINISRSEFNQCEIALLDDSFSAVDVETENQLMNELILSHWKKRTIIMSSHRLSLLPHADRVIFMKEGTIRATGSFQELLNTNHEFREFALQLEKTPENEIPL